MSEKSAQEPQLFDLTLTDEQRMTRESMQRFAETEMRELSRQVDESRQIPAEFFQKANELGITALAVPEAHGGAGFDRSPVSNVLIAEDLAHGDMALALAVLAPLGIVNALRDFGTEAQQATYLPRFVEENFYAAAVALDEPRVTFSVRELQTKAVAQGDGYVLNGVKSAVPLVETAQLFLVLAELEGQGPQAFLVEKDAAGVTAKAEPFMGLAGLQLGELKLEDVKLGKDALLGEGTGFDYTRFLDLHRLGACAAGLGVAQAVLDHTSVYVNERVAFGEPISHRQAVAFMVANIAIELESMRLLVWRAASRAEHGLDFHREAHLAYINCCERLMEIGTNGIQLLGGHGFTKEYFEEMWYRNLRSVAAVNTGFQL